MPSDSLDHITIKGFKSIASIENLELRPINILIGANGSGKSNFIGTFTFLHQIREGRLQRYVTSTGGAERLLHFGSKNTPDMTFQLSFQKGVNAYNLRLSATESDSLFPMEETAYYGGTQDQTKVVRLKPEDRGLEAGISKENLRIIPEWVRTRLGGWRVYHVHDTSSSSPMRKTAKVNDNQFLRPDGANLAAFLFLLKVKYPASYRLIRQTVQRVAPFFDDFRLEPLRLQPEDIKLEWSHTESDQYFDASSFSDGTLRFIVLTTLLLQPKVLRPSLIIVDEPELGLHPYAIGMLASLIRQASADTQVLVATQSALLLDHFDPEDVLVAERVAGATSIKRLDSTHLAGWLQDYSLGQLWEKNELGGRPGRE